MHFNYRPSKRNNSKTEKKLVNVSVCVMDTFSSNLADTTFMCRKPFCSRDAPLSRDASFGK